MLISTVRSAALAFALAFALIGICTVGAFVANGAQHHERTCFPAKHWNAEDAYRPCARVVRIWEDGSVRIAVSDANGTVRYTLGVGVPDSYERRAR